MKLLILFVLIGLCFARISNLRSTQGSHPEATFVATKQRPNSSSSAVTAQQEEENSISSTQPKVVLGYDDPDQEEVGEGIYALANKILSNTQRTKVLNENQVEISNNREKIVDVPKKSGSGQNHQDEYFYFSADIRKGRRKTLEKDEPEEETSEEHNCQRVQKKVEFKHINHKIDADNIIKEFLSF